MYINHKQRSSTTSNQVYEELKSQILNLQLAPGTSISEKEMSEKFNVSRTPVRESFLRLSREGLLNVFPQRGTFVSLIDLNLVEEARFMREHLERAVIRLACATFPQDKLITLEMNLSLQKVCIEQQDYRKMFELDEDYHKTIFIGCQKYNTWLVIQQMNVHFNRSRMLRLATDFNWYTIYLQHKEIFEGIKEKNPDKAEQLMQEHLMQAVLDKEYLKRSYPNYFK